MVSLLDVNMLIALAWPSHIHHGRAQTWFSNNAADGWATCPMTECAFIRISSNPKIIPEAVSVREAIALLEQFAALQGHTFWEDDIRFQHEYVPRGLLVGHRQITDAYLLGLAIHRRGRLVTLDRGLNSLIPTNSPHRLALHVIDI